MKRKLGVNTDCLSGLADELTTLALAKEAGFESITTSSTKMEDVYALKEKTVAYGMDFPFLHAPFRGINAMWEQGDGYLTLYHGMREAIDSAAACGVAGVVTHVSSGWQAPPVGDLGLSRYDALVDYAAEKGVALAFENLRMVGNLACLVDRYADRDNVRFCLDVGHEHCYTKTVTWMDIFTTKLFCTHIHDNVGRPFYDKVNDFDQHLLPFDGTCNYHRMMQKLDEYGYTGALTLEISRNARDDYKEMSGDAFLATAYDRLKRISVLNAPTVEKEI